MAIALKLKADGNLAQLAAADALDIDTIEPRSGGHLVIGATLGAGDEVQLGAVGENVRVMGDLIVDGSSTVSVDETVTGTFNANGDVNLGNNSGDTINLGGGTSDVVNLDTDMVLGAGIVGIGSSVTDYLDNLWLVAVNDNGPDLVAYGLNASGTNAGAYSIGVDPALIANSTATDLMTMLDDLDAAISAGGGETLQQTYALGNTIDVTTANGALIFGNSADVTDVLQLNRTFVGGGDALQISMGGGNEAVTGIGINLSSGTGATGDMLLVNNQGSGDAIDIQDSGVSVLQVTGAGQINLTPTSGQDINITAAGAGDVDIDTAAGAIQLTSATSAITLTASTSSQFQTTLGNLTLDAASSELIFDDVGNSGLTLSQASDRTLAQTAAGEVLNGATSVIGALNALATAFDLDGGPLVLERAIEDGVTVTAGNVIAASTVTGRVTNNNANNDTNARAIGIALTGGTGDAGGTVDTRIALPGSKVTDSGAAFTAGDALFAPDGTGRPTATAPSGTGDIVQRVGWALSATEYIVDFGPAVEL